MMLALLIDLGWKSALISGVALLVGRSMRRRTAVERVFLLRVAVAMLLALPVASLALPALDLAVLPAFDHAAPAAEVPLRGLAPVVPPLSRSDGIMDGATFLLALHLIGVAAVLLRLAGGIVTLGYWTRRGRPVDDPVWQAAFARAVAGARRPMRLVSSRDVPTPLSWGILPAWILIDGDSLLRRAQADAVLAHEIAHIRRLDWPMLLATRIAVALFWFDPLVWLLARTLSREGELAADETAVRSVARIDYAEALLAFASAVPGHGAALGMALWPSALRDRIARIVERRPHRRSSRFLLGTILAGGIAATPLLATARFVSPARPVANSARIMNSSESKGLQGPTVSAVLGDTAQASIAVPGMAPGSADLPFPTGQERVGQAAEAHAAAVTAPLPATRSAPVPVRIVGRTGAQVVTGPNGITILAAPAAPLPSPGPTLGRQRATEDDREDAVEGLRESAADLREQAADLERSAAEPDEPKAAREAYLKNANDLRRSAEKLEAEANRLTGG
jgi:hypothetical protein